MTYFVVVLCHGKLDLSLFCSWQGRKCYVTADIEAEIAEENSYTVLEKYVCLVAFTYTSPKVDMTASKLSPRKEKSGS